MKNVFCLALGITLLLFCGCTVGCSTTPIEVEEYSPYALVADSFVVVDGYLNGVFHVAHGSGAVVGHTENKTLVLTAAHICAKEKVGLSFVINYHIADIYIYDEDTDLCLLTLPARLDIPALRLAEEGPQLYETYYNASNPLGSATPHTGYAPLSSGIYMGVTETFIGESDSYGITVTSGSSGSPITNEQGQLVGMVSVAIPEYPIKGMSPPFNVLRDFLQEELEAFEAAP